MILAVDIGNTDVTFGVIDDFTVLARWALHSDLNRTEHEYADLVRAMLGYVDVGPITHAVVGSVVPALTERIGDALAMVTASPPLIVRAEAVPGIGLLVDDPVQVGVDRVANAVGARAEVGAPVIVADMGSVTTFDVVDARGDLCGVVIAPGIRALGQALTASGAQLPKIDIEHPEELVGRNTVDAMRSGVYWGYVELVRGVIRRLQAEPGGPWKTVATGGMAATLAAAVGGLRASGRRHHAQGPGSHSPGDDTRMSVLAGARIVLGVSGSIAAYKAAELASTLTQAGAHVDVALTRGAEQFVAPMTFEALSQRAVVTADTPMTSEHRIAHVEAGRAADVIVIAPATASAISRLALGLAEDIVTEIALVSAAPVVVAPAMEPGMLAHPATQANLSTLRGRGVHVVPPAEGRLASGATGQGRLPATEVLVDAVRLVLGRSGPLAGRSIVVSAGGTREFLDPVRYLGNRATGRQGVALSRAALERGAAVQLVLGAAVVEPPYGVAAQLVDSADAMLQALRAATQGCDALIMNAAVGDFRPTHQATAKIKRRAGVPAGAANGESKPAGRAHRRLRARCLRRRD